MGRMLKRSLLVTLVMLMMAAMALPAWAQEPVASVSTGSLNVRTGPGQQYGSIATLPYGFGVPMIGRNREGNWILIRLTNGVEGWVNLSFLFTQYPTRSLPLADTAIVTQPAVVPFATINAIQYPLRAGASLGDAAIATLSLGERVTLVGRNYNSTFAKVRRADGTEGWVETQAIIGSVPVRGLATADGSVFVPFAPTVPGVATATAAYYLRETASAASATVGLIGAGERVTLIGRSFDSSWVQVRLADGTLGWVSAAGLTSATRFSILPQTDGAGYLPPINTPSQPPPGATTYTVQPGDSLYSIGLRYGYTIDQLATVNGITNIDRIYVGQQLYIPAGG